MHLSSTYTKAKVAGSHRVENPVVLDIDTQGAIESGAPIMRACDSVYLTKEVPADFVSRADDSLYDEEEAAEDN